MAFQIERHAVLLAQVQNGAEAFDQQFQAHLAHVGDLVAADACGQRREQEPVAPAVGRRADEARQRHLAVLQLAQMAGEADARRAGRSVACWWIELADFVGDEVRIGARRVVALVAPGLVGLDRLAADELKRLGARLIAQRLALQVGGDGEDFQAVLLRLVDALLGIGRGAGVGVAAAEVEFPAGFFPAVEAGFLHEFQPLVLRHVAELAADQADLMVGAFAEAVLGRLMKTHVAVPLFAGIGENPGDAAMTIPAGRRKTRRQGLVQAERRLAATRQRSACEKRSAGASRLTVKRTSVTATATSR